MEDVSRRQAMKLAATTGVVATGIAALGAGEAEAQEEREGKTYKTKDGKTMTITKAMEDNYALIAQAAGEAAHVGFVDFMRRLTELADGQTINTFSGDPINFSQVSDFFAVLADASASFSFGPKITSTQGTKFRPAILEVDTAKFKDKAALVSGEFSCGGTIRW